MAFLELTDVSKVFPNAIVPAVDAFNLNIEGGEFVSFLGPSGCGKTTTLRMIAGFEVPNTGRIRMDDKDITDLRPRSAQHRHGLPVLCALPEHDGVG